MELYLLQTLGATPATSLKELVEMNPATDKSKIGSIGSNCRCRCPVCAGPCLGAPVRYRWLHTCLDLHQWETPALGVAR